MPSWVSFTPPSNSTDDLTQRIHELIEWYEQNFTRKEDDYIKANLQLIITLAKNVKNSDDIIFIERIPKINEEIITTKISIQFIVI